MTTRARGQLAMVQTHVTELERKLQGMGASPISYGVSQAWLRESGIKLQDMRRTLREVQQSMPTQQGRADASDFADGSPRSQYDQNRQALSRQDDALDVMGHTVSTIKDISTNIGEEVRDHNRVLNTFDTDIDRTGEKMRQTHDLLEQAMNSTSEVFLYALILALIVLNLLLSILL